MSSIQLRAGLRTKRTETKYLCGLNFLGGHDFFRNNSISRPSTSVVPLLQLSSCVLFASTIPPNTSMRCIPYCPMLICVVFSVESHELSPVDLGSIRAIRHLTHERKHIAGYTTRVRRSNRNPLLKPSSLLKSRRYAPNFGVKLSKMFSSYCSVLRLFLIGLSSCVTIPPHEQRHRGFVDHEGRSVVDHCPHEGRRQASGERPQSLCPPQLSCRVQHPGTTNGGGLHAALHHVNCGYA